MEKKCCSQAASDQKQELKTMDPKQAQKPEAELKKAIVAGMEQGQQADIEKKAD